MPSPAPGTLVLLLLVPLLAWRVYARFRRMVGRQRLSKVRPWITIAVFALLIALVASAPLAHGQFPWLLAAGVAAGAGLAAYGLRKTRFEPTPQGLFYTPNAHLGIALSLLFVARIAFRFVEVYAIDPSVPRGAAEFARSPLTLAVFGLLSGYYIGYAVGLARWRFAVLRAKRLREAAARGGPGPDRPDDGPANPDR
jgi:hypothetical protein